MSKRIFGYFSQKIPRRRFSYFYLFYIKYMYLDFFWKLLTKNPKFLKVYKYSGYLFILKRLPRWLSGKESTCQHESRRRFKSILLFSVLFSASELNILFLDSTYNWDHTVLGFVWIILHSIMSSRSIHNSDCHNWQGFVLSQGQIAYTKVYMFSHSVISDSLWPHGL